MKILETPNVKDVYAVAIGVDGELCRLNAEWEPLERMRALSYVHSTSNHR